MINRQTTKNIAKKSCCPENQKWHDKRQKKTSDCIANNHYDQNLYNGNLGLKKKTKTWILVTKTNVWNKWSLREIEGQ